MKLSLNELALCQYKYGKGPLRGIDLPDAPDFEKTAPSEAEQTFEALLQCDMITADDGRIHLTAWAHHLLNMMIRPEICILLDNSLLDCRLRLYFRNAYYLCVREDKRIRSDDARDRFDFRLLPNLETVVGAFVYALYPGDAGAQPRDGAQGDPFEITGDAWDRAGQQTSSFRAAGRSLDNTLRYRTNASPDGSTGPSEERESDVSTLVNSLTRWTLSRLAETMEREG